MFKSILAAAAVAAGLGLSAGAASALPGRGDLAMTTEASGLTLVQGRGWGEERGWRGGERGWRGGDRRVVVRRGGPPPWAPAWGRRERDRGYYAPRRERFVERRRVYEQRPGVSLRF